MADIVNIHRISGTEMVQLTPLRRTLAYSP